MSGKPGVIDLDNFSTWEGVPGLYAVFNVDGQTAVTEQVDGDSQVIHGSECDSFSIKDPFQLWQLADIGNKKWLIINKETGQYIAAKGVVVPQTGHADTSSAHWHINYAQKQGDNYKLYIDSAKFHGNSLTLENGSGADKTKIKCATQNAVKMGQVWIVKKQN